MSHALLWFRRDLRLFDNPALSAAVAEGAVTPV
jgi:deoxyribodipyrimidine photolyase